MHFKMNRVIVILQLVFAQMNLKRYNIIFMSTLLRCIFSYIILRMTHEAGHHRYLFNSILSDFNQAALINAKFSSILWNTCFMSNIQKMYILIYKSRDTGKL